MSPTKVNKLTARDLINTGIFSVIYFVMFFISGTLGYVPILAVMLPALLGILGGIPFMLFASKTGKFGAVTLMGTLEGILCFLMGQTWLSIVFGVVFGLLADLIMKSGRYQSWPKILIGYCVFTLWVVGSMLPMWIMRDAFFQMSQQVANADYLNAMMALTANWMLPVVVVGGLVGGLIGGLLGRAALKKHFVRAGIA